MRAKVELIAYADRFGGDLAGLRALLNGPLSGLFGGVHVLPFYRPFDGTDAGFDPQDHTEVDPRLGSWDDIAALSAGYRVMADMIINHVSASSPQFRDWLARGEASPYAGMFLTYGTAFPEGATEDTLTRLYRPRPGLPFSPYTLADGRKKLIWTTFTPQQVDLDVRHPVTRAYLLRVLVYYVGLLAGVNDMDLLACSGIGRDVNRHYYTASEIHASLARPVVQALIRLMRFRNTHPAFDGDMTCFAGPSSITMKWTHGHDEAVLDADLTTGRAQVTWTANGSRRRAQLASLP